MSPQHPYTFRPLTPSFLSTVHTLNPKLTLPHLHSLLSSSHPFILVFSTTTNPQILGYTYLAPAPFPHPILPSHSTSTTLAATTYVAPSARSLGLGSALAFMRFLVCKWPELYPEYWEMKRGNNSEPDKGGPGLVERVVGWLPVGGDEGDAAKALEKGYGGELRRDWGVDYGLKKVEEKGGKQWMYLWVNVGRWEPRWELVKGAFEPKIEGWRAKL